MNLLIDTTSQNLITVSLKEGQKIANLLEDQNQFGSQVLLPFVIKLLNKNRLTFADLKGIEVNTGPGSYTGLRVGASVAQALGYSLNIPVNGKLNKPVELKYT